MKMTVLSIVALFVVAIGAQDCQPTIKPPNIDSGCCGLHEFRSRIIGNSAAEVDEYPWVALLEYNLTDYIRTPCAGALISSRYVLTSARCLDNEVLGKPYQVRLSEYNTTSYPTDFVEQPGGGTEAVDVVIIAIEKQILHPGFERQSDSVTDDIGLVKLAQDAPYNDFIRPICLPQKDVTTTLADTRHPLLSTGWTRDGNFTDIKQNLFLPYVSLDDCKVSYSRLKNRVTLGDGNLCAGGEKNGQCGGQPGGPLMMEIQQKNKRNHDENTHILVGVDSLGSVSCGSGRPGVYTSVYKYLNWINNEAV